MRCAGPTARHSWSAYRSVQVRALATCPASPLCGSADPISANEHSPIEIQIVAISPNGAILVNVGFLETNYCLRRRAGDIAPFSSLATGRACRSWSALRIDAGVFSLIAPRSVPPWYCLHQERERPFEARRSRSGTLEVSQAHYDKIMRWDDQRSLASRTCHVICVPRHRKPTVTVDPEEALQILQPPHRLSTASLRGSL